MIKKRKIPLGLWVVIVPILLGIVYYFVVIGIILKKPILGDFHTVVSTDSLQNTLQFTHTTYAVDFGPFQIGSQETISVFSMEKLRILTSEPTNKTTDEKQIHQQKITFALKGSPDFLATDFAIVVGDKTTKQRFIKPMILFQNQNTALVLHQTTHFDETDRMFSFMSDSAIVLWTAPQAILFPELESNPQKTNSLHPTIATSLRTFSSKTYITVSMDSVGFLVFNKNTGQLQFYYHK